MRKILLIFFILAPLFSHAQNNELDSLESKNKYKNIFKEVNRKWALGIGGGVAGISTDYITGAMSFNITIKGFHADACIMPGEDHEHDVRVDKWTSDYYTSWHLGYQVPISRNIRIIPLVGFWTAGKSATDGADWTISGGQIVNKTSKSSDASGFDYGVQLNFKAKKVLLYTNLTRYSACAGIGFEFGGKK